MQVATKDCPTTFVLSPVVSVHQALAMKEEARTGKASEGFKQHENWLADLKEVSAAPGPALAGSYVYLLCI